MKFLTIWLLLLPNLLFAQVKDHAAYMANKLTPLEKKDMRLKNSREDGPYLLFQFGIRKHNTTHGENIYFNIYGEMDGAVASTYGYRKNNLSIETGLGFIWHNSERVYLLGNPNDKLRTHLNFNSLYLPIGIRYDIPIKKDKGIRFGVHSSANIIVFSTEKPIYGQNIPFEKSFESKGVSFDYQIKNKPIPSFFKIGIHTEFSIFKSSFLLIQGNYLISPYPYRIASYEWENQNQSGSFQDETKIDGWMFEIAYKLPLNIFHLEKE